MLDALLAPFLGGITGLIGSAINAYTKYKLLKMKYEYEKQLRQLDIEKMKTQAELQLNLLKAEVQGKVELIGKELEKEIALKSYDIATRELFKESYFNMLPPLVRSFIAFIFAIIDASRSYIRPFMTTLVITTSIFLLYYSILNIDTKAVLLVDTYPKLLDLLIYLSTTITSWWFGNRTTEKLLEEMMRKK